MDALTTNYKLGSLFDGSGGFPLAGVLCGIEPRWASEVEPYPIAVTRTRFPNMKHLGDISKINGAEIEPVDVITFGSPCQDLSVAGKRAGLKHEANGDEETTRSGLFMEAVRIIKEMREATNGEYPRFALWENVPGAFSSNKGEDFRVVLEELVKIVEPAAVMPEVPKNGWAYADSYIGDGWSLAYRVFDAQYWGVPQRRRRIHLIADFRGERAREVLFEREGVRGYFAEGGTPWQGIAGDAENGSGTADCEAVGLDLYNLAVTGDVAATLNANSGQSANHAGPTVMEQYLFENHSQDSRYRGPLDVCPMLPAQLGTGGNNQPFVVSEAIPINDKATRWKGGGATRNHDWSGNGLGVGQPGDPHPTLTAGDRHAVCYAETYQKVTGPLMANSHPGSYCGQDAYTDMLVVGKEQPIVFDKEVYNSGVNAAGGHYIADGGPAPALRTEHPPGVCVRHIVRRLTPTECARLQGFPDNWGHLDHKESMTPQEVCFWAKVRNTHAEINGKAKKQYTEEHILKWYNGLHTDSAEYKMWGNGIALPPALYVMQGIEDALKGT